MNKPQPLNTLGIIAFVWRSAGGLKEALRSFDLRVALLVCALSFGLWSTPKWAEVVVSVLPNLLGFTLGGYAVFLGFGSDDFKSAIVGNDEAESVYLSVSSAFMLFVFVQLFALLYALVALSLYFPPPELLAPYVDKIRVASLVGGAFGHFVFCYSLTLALRAAVRVFRLSRWYNHHLLRQKQQAAARVHSDCGSVGQ